MSIMMCDGCGEMVDTDYKPFYYDVEVEYVKINLCEECYIALNKGLYSDNGY